MRTQKPIPIIIDWGYIVLPHFQKIKEQFDPVWSPLPHFDRQYLIYIIMFTAMKFEIMLNLHGIIYKFLE